MTEAREWFRATGVRKHYGGVRALRGVDIDLRGGEVHGLIGPNGAGKSTLVKILAGAVRADAGEFSVDGSPQHLADSATARGLGIVMMPQELSILPSLTVADNVMLGDEITSGGFTRRRDEREATRAALDIIGLSVNPDALASSLSSIDRRLLMLARAVRAKARLVILDEPTAGLGESEARRVLDVVGRILDERTTVLYVSHHLSEVAEICDRVTCVLGGAVTERFSGDEVTRSALMSAVLGNAKLDGHPTGRSLVTAHPGVIAKDAARPVVRLEKITTDRLHEVSLSAHRGQVLGLAGILGSGVADAVGTITGRQRPAAGVVEVDGRPVVLRSPASALSHGIGYLAETRSQTAFHNMTVRENVSITALTRWLGRSGIMRRRLERRRVDSALATLSVVGDPGRRLSMLSGGNQQRALVARLLAADVDVLVIDEPTVGVDIQARAELWASLREIAQSRAVIVVSSYPEELVAICDRVLCLRKGHISAELTGDSVTEKEIVHATT
jgi:ABC-type sugar transport system ATPase subunit